MPKRPLSDSFGNGAEQAPADSASAVQQGNDLTTLPAVQQVHNLTTLPIGTFGHFVSFLDPISVAIFLQVEKQAGRILNNIKYPMHLEAPYLIKDFHLGSYISFLELADGAIYSFGSHLPELTTQDSHHKLPQFSNEKLKKLSSCRVSCGSLAFLMTLTNEGKIHSWGKNMNGFLGLKNFTDANEPIEVDNFVKLDDQVKDIISGMFHTLVLTDNGCLYTCGTNRFNTLGLGDQRPASEDLDCFTLIPSFDGEKHRVIQCAAGHEHSLALTAERRVLSWGCHHWGQLGASLADATIYDFQWDTRYLKGPPFDIGIDQYIKKNDHVEKIFASGIFSVFLTENGDVLTCGGNLKGQLGLPMTHSALSIVQDQDGNPQPVCYTPQKLKTFVNESDQVVNVILGLDFCIALTKDHKIYAWGNNDQGQLGLGDKINRHEPTLLELTGLEEGDSIIEIKAGMAHCIARTAKGKFYTWGSNKNGELNLGDNIDRLSPVPLSAAPINVQRLSRSIRSTLFSGQPPEPGCEPSETKSEKKPSQPLKF